MTHLDLLDSAVSRRAYFRREERSNWLWLVYDLLFAAFDFALAAFVETEVAFYSVAMSALGALMCWFAYRSARRALFWRRLRREGFSS